MPDATSSKVLLKSFLPFSSVAYWYFTAYCGLFLFMPILDSSIVTIPQKKMRGLLLSLGGVFCILAAFRCSPDDVLGIGYGYSLIWLCVLYLIGAYLKKYDSISGHSLWSFVIGYIISVAFLLSIRLISKKLGVFALEQYICSYTALPALTSAICIFGICLHVRIPSLLQKVINGISPYVFGVYLLHVHPIVFKHLFTADSSNPLLKLYRYGGLQITLLIGLSVFLIGIIIDSIRVFGFRVIGVQHHLRVIDKWWE